MGEQHTPGPWSVSARSMWVTARDEKGLFHVADIRGWGHLTGKGYGAWGYPEAKAIAIQEANARLIAAAPDLLEALKAVLAEWREGYGLNCLNQVTQAIRKAEDPAAQRDMEAGR